jgi:hypothetical protein
MLNDNLGNFAKQGKKTNLKIHDNRTFSAFPDIGIMWVRQKTGSFQAVSCHSIVRLPRKTGKK